MFPSPFLAALKNPQSKTKQDKKPTVGLESSKEKMLDRVTSQHNSLFQMKQERGSGDRARGGIGCEFPALLGRGRDRAIVPLGVGFELRNNSEGCIKSIGRVIVSVTSGSAPIWGNPCKVRNAVSFLGTVVSE